MKDTTNDTGIGRTAPDNLMDWASRKTSFTFGEGFEHLCRIGLRTQAARDTLRSALDRRLLIAKVPLGEIQLDTRLLPVCLKRGQTTLTEVTGIMGEADFRHHHVDGSTTFAWTLAEGALKGPSSRTGILHRERDRRMADAFGRSHVPFGPLFLGERLILRCRFGRDGSLRSHRIEVR
jgi:hypothetical protein